jgi:uncharacterized lipoprotein YajG
MPSHAIHVGVGACLCFLLTSCTYQAQVIHLNPAPSKADTIAAANDMGTEIILTTHDARSSQEIGHRASGSNHETPITTDTDIAALLQSQMTDILKAKGVRVLSSGPSTDPTLDVQLKELSYVTFDASGQRKVKIQALLETIITSGPKTFRKTFKTQQERQIVFEPVAKSNEEWINETFSDALKEVANDSQLYSNLL